MLIFYRRSLCSLVCKWLYDVSSGDLLDHGWNEYLLDSIGLSELVNGDSNILGKEVCVPGQV